MLETSSAVAPSASSFLVPFSCLCLHLCLPPLHPRCCVDAWAAHAAYTTAVIMATRPTSSTCLLALNRGLRCSNSCSPSTRVMLVYEAVAVWLVPSQFALMRAGGLGLKQGWQGAKSTRCVGKSLMMICSARWDALIVERVNGEPTDQQPSTPHAFASAAHPPFTCGPCKQGEKSVKCALALPTDLERKLVGGHLLATASNAQSTERIEACSHHAMPAYCM